MNMSKREKLFVGTAAIVFALFILIFFVIRPMVSNVSIQARASGGSLSQLREEVRERAELAKRLGESKERLSVKIPSQNIQEQISAMISTMESVAGKNRIKFSTFSPEAVSPGRAERNRQPGSDISFDLKFSTDSNNFVSFIQGLETEGLPFKIESLAIKGDMQKPDSLDVTMRLSIYMLDPISGPAKEEEKPDAPTA